MKPKHFLLLLFVLSMTSHGQVQAMNPENGPNDCLLNDTPNCPISFMLKAFCLRDSASCWHMPGSDSYGLNNRIFLRNYSEYLFGVPAGVLFPTFDVLEHYPTATLHEIFEFGICHNDPLSCYPEGVSGLTIYHDASTECPPEQRDSDQCQGGPRDSKICQVTPEACTGSYIPD